MSLEFDLTGLLVQFLALCGFYFSMWQAGYSIVQWWNEEDEQP